jgi:hypothetical protein
MFDFRLAKSLPRPCGSLFFCLLFFGGLCIPYLRNVEEVGLSLSHGSLYDFIIQERSETPKHPSVILSGSSLSGMGFHTHLIEEQLQQPVGKISLDASTVCDVLGILECYEQELSNTKILFLELAPARLRREQESFLKEFFGNPFFNPYIQEKWTIASLQNFLSSSRYSAFAIIRSSVIIYKMHHTKHLEHFQESWYRNEQSIKNESERVHMLRQPLKQNAVKIRQLRKERGDALQGRPLSLHPADSGKNTYKDGHFVALDNLLKFCCERGIFVVVCVTPHWYGQLFTQQDLEKPSQDRYIQLLQEIQKRPDCEVIICRDFEEITGEQDTDEQYLFDYGHMREEGAKVYSNWLIDRLMQSPKFKKAL